MRFLFLALTIAACFSAEARVFHMKDGKFAGYLNATYGSATIKKDFFEGESSATGFSKGFSANTGGEFGFLYRTDVFNWIFGFEMIKPNKVSGQASTGSTVNYRYSSEVSAFAPKVGLEVVVYQSQKFRFLVNGTVGTASLATKTEYSALTIAPNTNFTIEGKSSANLITAGMGGEWHMSDNTTAFLHINYRDLKFRKIKYAEDAANSFQGAQNAGETLTRLDGSRRKVDMTGTYASIGLRFWLF